jgi:hypothetical protein
MPELKTPEAICEFIQKAHDAYLHLATNVQEDCRQIVALCYQVVDSILRLFVQQQEVCIG